MIDEIAARQAARYGIPECLRVPVAATDEAAIQAHVGEVTAVLSGNGKRLAFLVKAHPSPAIDASLPIWQNPASAILYDAAQVWVHIGYSGYRRAFRRAFPDIDIANSVISHAMNRRIALLKGFKFVRITPTSRSANSSSAFSEGWGVTLHGEPSQMAAHKKRGASVEYADLTHLMLMMDMKLGGGVMDAVNEGQKLIRPSPAVQL